VYHLQQQFRVEVKEANQRSPKNKLSDIVQGTNPVFEDRKSLQIREDGKTKTEG